MERIMKDESMQSVTERRKYVAPSVERVILDPVKEMLQGCPIVEGGKSGTACGIPTNFS
jgi:hypothetical protein